MHWPWSKQREVRNLTTTILDAALARAEGTASVSPFAVGAAESVGGLQGRAMARANVNPPSLRGVLSPDVLYDMGRRLVLDGQWLALLEVGREGPRLIRPSNYKVSGSYEPESWVYDIWMVGPTSTTRMRAGRDRVVHIILNASTDEPWRGRSALSVANQTGRALGELEAAIANESQSPVGSLIASPEGAPNVGTLQKRLNGLRGARGGTVALVESVAGGYGDRGAAPAMDWKPHRLAPAFTAAEVDLRESVEATVCGLLGAHPILISGRGDGTLAREQYRRFLRTSVESTAEIAAVECGRVLGQSVSFDFSKLRAGDTTGMARTFRSLVGREASVPIEQALALAGFNDPPGPFGHPEPSDE